MKKKTKNRTDDSLRGEYDSSLIRSGVRGKYAERFHKGTKSVTGKRLDGAYKQMASDEVREKEAVDFVEGVVMDVADETRCEGRRS